MIKDMSILEKEIFLKTKYYNSISIKNMYSNFFRKPLLFSIL